MTLQGIAATGRIADAKLRDRDARKPTLLGIGARLLTFGELEAILIIACGHLADVDEGRTLLLADNLAVVGLRQCDTDFIREPLDRLAERQALRFHEETEDVAMLAGREAVIEPLLIIDEKARRLLRIERRQAGVFAALLAQLHAPSDHIGHGQPGANFIEDLRGVSHEGEYSRNEWSAQAQTLPF